MKLLLLSALIAVALSQPMGSFDDEYQWGLFKVEHMKEYESEVEDQKRREIFMSNLKLVREHNAKYEQGEVTFELEINKFADMTNKEFLETMTGFINPTEHNETGEDFALDDSSDLQKTIDWRKKGAVTNVKSQLDCGSCWAFSATGVLEGQWFLKKGELVSLSEQNLIDCAGEKYNNYGCRGGSKYGSLQYIVDNDGIDTEESYPYEGRDSQTCRYSPENKGATARSYVKVTSGEDSLQKAVSSIGPISVSMDASGDQFQLYKGGIYTDPDCSSEYTNHAVLVVGYGTTTNGEDYWLVKNSWGTDWGMDGYIMIARNSNNMCGIASYGRYPKV